MVDYNTAAKEARSKMARGFCPELLSSYKHTGAYPLLQEKVKKKLLI